MLLGFKASSMKRAYFSRFSRTFVFGFKPTNKMFSFIELTIFLCFDSKVPSLFGSFLWINAHKSFLQKR